MLADHPKIAIPIACLLGVLFLFVGFFWNYSAAYFLTFRDGAFYQAFMAGDIFAAWPQIKTYYATGKIAQPLSLAATMSLIECIILLAGAGYIILTRHRSAPPKGMRLATIADLKRSGLLSGTSGYSILLGRLAGREIRYTGDSHILVNGPTRSGKGYGFVFANAMQWRGSLLATDLKLEVWERAGPARLMMGQKIHVFAPGAEKSHRWNPLDSIRPWPMRATDLASLGKAILKDPPQTDPYWVATGRGLFMSLCGYVLESPNMEGRRHMGSVLATLSTGTDISKLLMKILVDEPDLNIFILNGFRQFLGRDEEQRPSFTSHILTALAPWNNAAILAATETSDFRIEDMRRKPFTVFIGTPAGDFAAAEIIITLFVQRVHDVLLRSLPASDEPHRVLGLLDEFYQFGRQQEIVDRMPLVAGYGIQLAFITQGLPAIDARYNRTIRDMVLGNLDVKLSMGFGDDDTAGFFSNSLGKHWVEREGWSRSRRGVMNNMSQSGRWEQQPLIDKNELKVLDNDKAVLLVRGAYGCVLDKINWYTDKEFILARNMAEPAARQLSIPTLIIKDQKPLKFAPWRASVKDPSALTLAPTDAVENFILGPAYVRRWRTVRDRVEKLARALFERPGLLLDDFDSAVLYGQAQGFTAILQKLRATPNAYSAFAVVHRPVLAFWTNRNVSWRGVSALRHVIILAWREEERIRRERNQVGDAELAASFATNDDQRGAFTGTEDPLGSMTPGTAVDTPLTICGSGQTRATIGPAPQPAETPARGGSAADPDLSHIVRKLQDVVTFLNTNLMRQHDDDPAKTKLEACVQALLKEVADISHDFVRERASAAEAHIAASHAAASWEASKDSPGAAQADVGATAGPLSPPSTAIDKELARKDKASAEPAQPRIMKTYRGVGSTLSKIRGTAGALTAEAKAERDAGQQAALMGAAGSLQTEADAIEKELSFTMYGV